MHKSRRACLAFTLLLATAGCSLAPTYQPPATVTPPAFKEAGPWIPASPTGPAPTSAWWTSYGDPTLDSLEAKIATGNPTLAAAAGRYDEARAYLRQSRADLFPHVSAGADLERDRQSDNRPLRGSGQPDVYSADTADAQIGYELDLWGRVRNAVAAGKAQAQASGDDLAQVRLSLQTLLGTSYMTLRGYDQQIALLSQTVDAYAKADAMTRQRFTVGIADGIDTGRSGDLLAEAQAQLQDVRGARALTEHAIASLVGTPASSFAIAPAQVDFTIPPVPVGLPSTLLQRRPDIAAAERRMFAANRAIGVAKAAFYPSISLGLLGGYQNTGLADLFSAGNTIWALGPSVQLPIFDGGKRRAQLEIARAGWTQATASYRSNVLQAFQDVEDNLALLHYLGNEDVAEHRAVTQAAQAEQLSLDRYQRGAVGYLDVVTAQTTALRVRRAAIDLRTRQLQASVNLIKAIGGGWAPAHHG